MALARLSPAHRPGLEAVLRATPEFTPEEVAVALELIDLGLAGSTDYRFWVEVDEVEVDEEEGGSVRGYVCFGKTPMTEATYDLYWIAVLPSAKGRGIGRALAARMEEELLAEGGRLVRLETASVDAYAGTHAFYERIGFAVLARIEGFYTEKNDLLIYGRYLRR